MRYAQTRAYDIANGPGIRATLFVSGCTHQCKGCFNQEYQDFDYGTPFGMHAQDNFMSLVKDDKVTGVTILGGEPMDHASDKSTCTLNKLIKLIKKETGKNIWLYSGYTYEQIVSDPKKLEILSRCDVLVDGKFDESLKDITLKFKGSSNQRIIDIQESLLKGKVVLNR